MFLGIINRIVSFLTSMRLMSILLLLFAFVIGYATFIENDFGRSTAKSLVFSSWWFELILALLVFNLVNNIVKYRLFRWEKIAALTFHVSFIVILIGSAITRYISYEGMMHIREGDSTNLFISDDTFLKIHIDDRVHQYKYEKKLFLSGIYDNSFDINVDFKDNDISINYIDFLPSVTDSIITGVAGGKKALNLVVPGKNGMQDEFLFDNQQKIIKGRLFTLNNPQEGAINLFYEGDFVTCISTEYINTMSMLNQQTKVYDPNIKFNLNRKTLHTVNDLSFVLKDIFNDAKNIQVSKSSKMTDGSEDALIINVSANGNSKEVVLYGGKGYQADEEFFAIDNLNFKLSYGSKYYTTPFRIKLRDFQLDRYPGSESPSSYAAEVTVLDGSYIKDYRIFMNNVLNYKGYRFFQSSYDKDEKGTILSVNFDWWGTLITYIGYFLLGLGFLLVFLTKNTRYNLLSKKLDKLSLIIIFTLFSSTFSIASDTQIKNEFNQNHISKFDALVVQDNGGRLKPLHTLTSEYLRKIYGKSSYIIASSGEVITSTEVILHMMYNPKEWGDKPIIKVSHPELRNLLGSEINKKYVHLSFNTFFDSTGTYLLNNDVELAYAKLPKDRGTYDKDVIKVDERVNLCFAIFSGSIFRLFPLPNDKNNTWYDYTQSYLFSNKDSLFVANIIPMYFQSLREAFIRDKWTTPDTIITYINKFQNKYGEEVIPSQKKINYEILYNKINIFSSLFLYYFLSGIILVFMYIFSLFNKNNIIKNLITVLKYLIVIGFILHTLGLGLRWYISGHAPWSNGYESMIYISWATILSGIVYAKRSVLTLAATGVVAGLLLMVAHLNWLDPSITNLVPVLNSYWLLIHVAIITSSYGFLSLAAILGLISLWLIIFTNSTNKNKLDGTLKEITIINEKSIEVGLFMLTIGTFLGGVWANESWGRYWGWDPKETWALVSILIYSFVLHMRFIPALKGILTFNAVSMFAIWTIIMTYFGVNYYLSGLHSYAAGDPMPIPVFVYYLLAIMIVSTFIAKLRYKKNY